MIELEQPHRNGDFYKSLRIKIRSWASREGKPHAWSEWILLAPDLFHLLVRLMADNRVPKGHRVRIAAAAAYFVSPIDFLPELFLGPSGYLDDVAVAAYALHLLLNVSDPAVVQSHWAGEGDILTIIQTIVSQADRMLGSGLAGKVRKWIRSR